MSRTDATRPYWVKVYDPSMPTTIRHDHTREGCRVQTLAEAQEVTVSRPYWMRGNPPCIPWLPYNSSCYGSHFPRPKLAGEITDLVFERPARQRARRACRAALREWNAYGETTIEVTPYRPVGAEWYWD